MPKNPTPEADVVNMHAAKSQLSRLVEAAIGGREVIIARDGTPAVRLVPVQPAPRVPGALAGLRVPASFFEPLPDDALDAFER